MPRETIEQKAKRLLAEGRLTVLVVNPEVVVARCKGDSGAEYMLGWDKQHLNWICSCPANTDFHRKCAHLRALWLVTVKPTPGAPG